MTDKKHIGSNFDDFLKEECIKFEEQELKKTKLRKNRKDLTGMKFGKLLCLKPVITGKNNHSEWLCECECGNYKIAQTYRLLSGRVQTCGDCYHTTNHYIPMIKELKQALNEIKDIVKTCNSGVICSECPYTEKCKTDTEAEALGVCKLIQQKLEGLDE